MDVKVCPECSFEIIGRKNKKFCSDRCRNAFNNRMNKEGNKMVRRINTILRKNRIALLEVAADNRKEIKRSALLDKGFEFSYFTHLVQDKSGRTYYYCYDIGFWIKGEEKIVLVKQAGTT